MKLKKFENNEAEHWIFNILSLDGTEAAAYENYKKGIEKWRSDKETEERITNQADKISQKEAQEIGEKIQDTVEQEIVKALNKQRLRCRITKK